MINAIKLSGNTTKGIKMQLNKQETIITMYALEKHLDGKNISNCDNYEALVDLYNRTVDKVNQNDLNTDDTEILNKVLERIKTTKQIVKGGSCYFFDDFSINIGAVVAVVEFKRCQILNAIDGEKADLSVALNNRINEIKTQLLKEL